MSSKYEIVKCRKEVTSGCMGLPEQRHGGLRGKCQSGVSGLLHIGRPSDHVGEQSETRLDRWVDGGLREG